MENLDHNAKKVELLSDEELLKVSGGNGINPEVMNNAKKAMCNSAKSKKDCEKMDFCIWKVIPTSWKENNETCQYKG